MTNLFLDPKTKQLLSRLVFSYKGKRDSVFENLGVSEQSYKEKVSGIRKKIFENFEGNLELAEKNLSKNGFVVHRAENKSDSLKILKELLTGSAHIVKSKSNTTREIGLDELAGDIGKITETDLGDFIVDMMKTEDMHYVLPALHVLPEEISLKIKEIYNEEVDSDPASIARSICSKIRENILKADVGITGANFFTTTGEIVLLENEGNISLVSRVPKKHIVVVGVDKLVSSVEDAVSLSQSAAIFGTGQQITQYISIISGPSKTADIQNELVVGAQGPNEVHIILVDNGRKKMMESGFSDMAGCINCGACINFCPVYHNLGVRYGGSYLGSKGIVTSAFLNSGDEQFNLENSKKNGSHNCTLCGNCQENCPMKIDLPEMVKKIRVMQNAENIQTPQNQEMLEKTKEYGNPFGKKKNDSGKIPDKLYCC